MILDGNDPLFDRVPPTFVSPFPSDSSLLSEKFQALLGNVPSGQATSIGQDIVTRAQASAWRDALAIATKVRATTQGILSDWLPQVASIAQIRPGVFGPRGLWAEVNFPSTPTLQGLVDATNLVGLQPALDFLGAAPIVGFVMKGILGLGSFLDRLFNSPEPEEDRRILLPWTDYQKDTDQDLVQKYVIEGIFPRVDWTGLFSPSTEIVPWKLAVGIQNDREVGQVFAPMSGNGKDVAHSSTGLGSMPGTGFVAGHLQAPKFKRPDASLIRYFASGAEMHFGKIIVQTGEFYPALAQTLTLAWQMASDAGAPEMFTVDCDRLELLWSDWFSQFFDSLWFTQENEDQWAGEFAAPYLVVGTNAPQLGLRAPQPGVHRPHPAPLFTRGIFKDGPATAATRNVCLYAEPTSGKMEQYGYPPDYTFSGPQNRLVASNGPAFDPKKWSRKGYRCVPWPDPIELLSKYRRPDEALILPAIRRLRERQRACLKTTLVCAYVRPVEAQGLPPHGAFAHPQRGKQLRDLCLEMQAKLLQHEARFAVMLKDVEVVNPDFAKQLRAAGVTNSLQQLSKAKQLAGAGGKAEEPIPDPIPPQGGVPFGDFGVDAGGGKKPTGPGGAQLGKAAALAVGGYLAFKMFG